MPTHDTETGAEREPDGRDALEVGVDIKAQSPTLESAWQTIAWWHRTCAYWYERAQEGYRLRDSIPARDAVVAAQAKAEALAPVLALADQWEQDGGAEPFAWEALRAASSVPQATEGES